MKEVGVEIEEELGISGNQVKIGMRSSHADENHSSATSG